MASEEEKVTFRSMCIMALNTVADEERMGAEAKAKCYQLSLKFFKKGKEVDLTVDEATFIKERAGKILSALAYGRLCDWIEGVDNDEDEVDDTERIMDSIKQGDPNKSKATIGGNSR